MGFAIHSFKLLGGLAVGILLGWELLRMVAGETIAMVGLVGGTPICLAAAAWRLRRDWRTGERRLEMIGAPTGPALLFLACALALAGLAMVLESSTTLGLVALGGAVVLSISGVVVSIKQGTRPGSE